MLSTGLLGKSLLVYSGMVTVVFRIVWISTEETSGKTIATEAPCCVRERRIRFLVVGGVGCGLDQMRMIQINAKAITVRSAAKAASRQRMLFGFFGKIRPLAGRGSTELGVTEGRICATGATA
jgi:hypothetical protein